MAQSYSRTRRIASRREIQRHLGIQTLDARTLLAADVGAEFAAPPLPPQPPAPPAFESFSLDSSIDVQSDSIPEDANEDGEVSALDALTIINRLNRGGGEAAPIESIGRNAARPRDRMDVNGDGIVSALDALMVINRMNRGRNADQVPDRGPIRPPEVEVQSIDGTGNNLERANLGAAGTALVRIVDADYADGIAEPAGEDRLSAREISNIVFDQDESIPSSKGLSNLVWQWGQFIDHDITATAGGDGEAFNIAVPLGDEHFDPFGTGDQIISFTRSAVAEGTGVETPADQVNNITAFIDGSMVYGSDLETSESLRSFEGGRLRTSEGNLLPVNEQGFFQAGDARVNEQLGLISMQTLWMREHNRVAGQIAAGNPSLNDEEIFQRARRIVIAEIQAITFNEYLPQLLGRDAIDRYEGYDSSVDPSISNLFATAAFRYGHTSLPSELARLADDGSVIEAGSVALADAFFNPSEIQAEGIDSILKGLASTPQQEIDTRLVDDVRNFLFGPPGAGGFDLAALNIQRGRDHGLPDYNAAREAMGLARAETFADVSSDTDVQARLALAYESVDDIDVWVGMLAEDHVNGGTVGELAATVIAEQFMALRDGDRFWYQNVLSSQQAREIGGTRLSDVIERNTELTSVQDNAFRIDQSPRDEDPLPPGRPNPVDQLPDERPDQRPDLDRNLDPPPPRQPVGAPPVGVASSPGQTQPGPGRGPTNEDARDPSASALSVNLQGGLAPDAVDDVIRQITNPPRRAR
ncbi:peroxidase family protein [Neorhodopirellula pilleata]|uniref:Peroxidase n=1 Tax=Neorhodopirellula pilleata TaxID=2714738 RepID=A0A5C6AS71_9BACT|nr:peroxidase family protein [Neorhodopirellula pilleata]TWU01936.1 peroxidase [Neorhodopirellula pilleata]